MVRLESFSTPSEEGIPNIDILSFGGFLDIFLIRQGGPDGFPIAFPHFLNFVASLFQDQLAFAGLQISIFAFGVAPGAAMIVAAVELFDFVGVFGDGVDGEGVT